MFFLSKWKIIHLFWGIGKGGLDSAITQKAVKSEIEKKVKFKIFYFFVFLIVY